MSQDTARPRPPDAVPWRPPDGASLRDRLRSGSLCSFLGVWDAVSASVAESAGFDALWASGLCVAAAEGLPDAEVVSYETLVRALDSIRRGSRLPVLADGNTGFGDPATVAEVVRRMEQAEIDGICLEDKAYPRSNSLSTKWVGVQKLADPVDFAIKLRAAAEARRSPDFLVVARLESLVSGQGVGTAIQRARLYVEAGADAVVVHATSSSSAEPMAFARAWLGESGPEPRPPLILIPTTFPSLSRSAAAEAGISGVVYANQLLRAAVASMRALAVEAAGADRMSDCRTPQVPVHELFDLPGLAESTTAEATQRRWAEDFRRLVGDRRSRDLSA